MQTIALPYLQTKRKSANDILPLDITEIPRNLVVKRKLSPRSGSVALTQTNSVDLVDFIK